MHQNNTALTCKLVSILLGIMVLVAGGEFTHNVILMISIWISGLAFCILIFGIGEIISLLQKISNNQNNEPKPTGKSNSDYLNKKV